MKKRCWAVKAQVGMALPAEDGTYKIPVSAGVTVERKLNDYLGIETGLLYSNLRSAGQHLHYLGIPVRVNVTLVDTKKVDLYATVGGVADKCIAGLMTGLRFLPSPVFRIISVPIRNWLRYARSGRLTLTCSADFA